MYYAYILRSDRDPRVYYYGFTTDLKSRLIAHNQGENVSTRGLPRDFALGALLRHVHLPPACLLHATGQCCSLHCRGTGRVFMTLVVSGWCCCMACGAAGMRWSRWLV